MKQIDYYLINLNDRPDRLQNAVKQCHSKNISFIRFGANRPDDKGEYHSIGTRGCCESHTAIVNDIQPDDGFTLVMEDDLIFNNEYDFTYYFDKYIEILENTDFDICYFYDHDTNTTKTTNIALQKSKTWCNHFFLYNNRNIEKIRNTVTNHPPAAFDVILRESSLNQVSTVQNLVLQNYTFGSDILTSGRIPINSYIDTNIPSLYGKWIMKCGTATQTIELSENGKISSHTNGKYSGCADKLILNMKGRSSWATMNISFDNNGSVNKNLTGTVWYGKPATFHKIP